MDGRWPETDGEFDSLRDLAQSLVDGNGDLRALRDSALELAERYIALHDRLTASGNVVTRIVRLREGDSLPYGTRFSQIVGSEDERVGTRLRRVYLVLVEQTGG